MLHLSFSFEYEDGGNFRMELHMTASSSRISPCPSPADPGSAAVVAHAAVPSSGAGSMDIALYLGYDLHAREVRRAHEGRTSRGLAVEAARFAFDYPIWGEVKTELLADLRRCAAVCIGAGCQPR